jgi:hypothetical protein
MRREGMTRHSGLEIILVSLCWSGLKVGISTSQYRASKALRMVKSFLGDSKMPLGLER